MCIIHCFIFTANFISVLLNILDIIRFFYMNSDFYSDLCEQWCNTWCAPLITKLKAPAQLCSQGAPKKFCEIVFRYKRFLIILMLMVVDINLWLSQLT